MVKIKISIDGAYLHAFFGLLIGMGKRHGTANDCLPFKVMWISRNQVVLRFLKNMHNQKNINKHIYHYLYVLVKGNQFNNKRDILESIHNLKAVRTRERSLNEQ